METPLPEAHLPGDPGQNILGPEDSQSLCKNDVGKEKGSLGVTTTNNYPCHSAATIAVKRRPTAPEGVAYQLANCAARRRQQLCHKASSGTPLYRCDSLLWCEKFPLTSRNNRYITLGVKSRGATSPSTQITSTCAPFGVSPSLSPSYSSSCSSLASVSTLLPVASWRSCLWSLLLGGRGLLPRPPVSPVSTSPMPPPLLHVLPLTLAPWMCRS